MVYASISVATSASVRMRKPELGPWAVKAIRWKRRRVGGVKTHYLSDDCRQREEEWLGAGYLIDTPTIGHHTIQAIFQLLQHSCFRTSCSWQLGVHRHRTRRYNTTRMNTVACSESP